MSDHCVDPDHCSDCNNPIDWQARALEAEQARDRAFIREDALLIARQEAERKLRDAIDIGLERMGRYLQAEAERDALRAKLAAVEALHRPFAIYDECNCKPNDDGETLHDGAKVVEVGEGEFWTCLPPSYRICATCCAPGGYQTEDCATGHNHGPDIPICETRKALES